MHKRIFLAALAVLVYSVAPAPMLAQGRYAVPTQDPCRDPVYLAMRRVDVGLMTKAEYEAFHLRDYACRQYSQTKQVPLARPAAAPDRLPEARPIAVYAPERQPQTAAASSTPAAELRPGAPSYALNRGSLMISGQGHFESTGWNDDDDFDIRRSELRVNPSLQYFVAPGLAIGGEITVYRLGLGGLTGTNLGIGPRLGYYFGAAGAAVHPFIATSGTFYYSPTDESTAIGVRPSLGLLVMLARSVGITGEGFFRYDAALSEGEGSTNAFGLAVGLSAFVF